MATRKTTLTTPDSIILDSIADLKKVIVDTKTSNIIYIGRSLKSSALTTEPLWQIQRIITQGSITTREFAADALYSNKWDEREALFPAPTLLNNLSTRFSGTGQYVAFGDSHLYDVGSQFTMSFWVWIDNVASQRCIYSKVTQDANVYGISLQVTTAGKIFLQVRSSGSLSNYAGTLNVPTQEWVHIAVTYNGGNNLNGFRVYINSAVDATPASTAHTASILSGQPAMLGARNGAFYHSGYIDEVTFWGINFNQEEITALYNEGSPADPQSHPLSSRLESYYTMGDNDIYPTLNDHEGFSPGIMINMGPSNLELFTA